MSVKLILFISLFALGLTSVLGGSKIIAAPDTSKCPNYIHYQTSVATFYSVTRPWQQYYGGLLRGSILHFNSNPSASTGFSHIQCHAVPETASLYRPYFFLEALSTDAADIGAEVFLEFVKELGVRIRPMVTADDLEILIDFEEKLQAQFEKHSKAFKYSFNIFRSSDNEEEQEQEHQDLQVEADGVVYHESSRISTSDVEKYFSQDPVEEAPSVFAELGSEQKSSRRKSKLRASGNDGDNSSGPRLLPSLLRGISAKISDLPSNLPSISISPDEPLLPGPPVEAMELGLPPIKTDGKPLLERLSAVSASAKAALSPPSLFGSASPSSSSVSDASPSQNSLPFNSIEGSLLRVILSFAQTQVADPARSPYLKSLRKEHPYKFSYAQSLFASSSSVLDSALSAVDSIPAFKASFKRHGTLNGLRVLVEFKDEIITFSPVAFRLEDSGELIDDDDIHPEFDSGRLERGSSSPPPNSRAPSSDEDQYPRAFPTVPDELVKPDLDLYQPEGVVTYKLTEIPEGTYKVKSFRKLYYAGDAEARSTDEFPDICLQVIPSSASRRSGDKDALELCFDPVAFDHFRCASLFNVGAWFMPGSSKLARCYPFFFVQIIKQEAISLIDPESAETIPRLNIVPDVTNRAAAHADIMDVISESSPCLWNTNAPIVHNFAIDPFFMSKKTRDDMKEVVFKSPIPSCLRGRLWASVLEHIVSLDQEERRTHYFVRQSFGKSLVESMGEKAEADAERDHAQIDADLSRPYLAVSSFFPMRKGLFNAGSAALHRIASTIIFGSGLTCPEGKIMGYTQQFNLLVPHLIMHVPEWDAYWIVHFLASRHKLTPIFCSGGAPQYGEKIFQKSKFYRTVEAAGADYYSVFGIFLNFLQQFFLTLPRTAANLHFVDRVMDVLLVHGMDGVAAIFNQLFARRWPIVKNDVISGNLDVVNTAFSLKNIEEGDAVIADAYKNLPEVAGLWNEFYAEAFPEEDGSGGDIEDADSIVQASL